MFDRCKWRTIAVGLCLTAATACAGSAAHAKTGVGEQDRRAFQHFLDVLLTQKNPQAAYEGMAAPNLVQHNPPFGSDRASTIKQWETMTSRPESRFELKDVSYDGDIVTWHFVGHLQPGPSGADVVQRDRLRDGKIVEEWGEFHIIMTP